MTSGRALSLESEGLLGLPLTLERALDPEYGRRLVDECLESGSLTPDQTSRIVEWTALIVEHPGVFVETVLCGVDSQMAQDLDIIQKRFRAAETFLSLYNKGNPHPVVPRDIIEEGVTQFFDGALKDFDDGVYTRVRQIVVGSRPLNEIYSRVEVALFRAMVTRIARELYSVGKPDFSEVEFMLKYFSHYNFFLDVSEFDLVVLAIGEALDHLGKVLPRPLVFRRGVELLYHLNGDNQPIPEAIKQSMSNVDLDMFFTETQAVRILSAMGYYLKKFFETDDFDQVFFTPPSPTN